MIHVYNQVTCINPTDNKQYQITVNDQSTMQHIKLRYLKQLNLIQYDPKGVNYIVTYKKVMLNDQFTYSQLRTCIKNIKIGQQLKTIKLQIVHRDFQSLYDITKDYYKQILIVWTDNNKQQNYKTILKMTKLTDSTHRVRLVQVESNKQLLQFIQQNQIMIKILYQLNRLFFISNMNRPPTFANQGISTLEVALQNRPNQKVVFYIGNVEKTRDVLIKRYTNDQLQNVFVVNTPQELQKVYVDKFLTRLKWTNSLIISKE